MTETYAQRDTSFLDLQGPNSQYRPRIQGRVKLPQLVEVNDVKILGQDAGLLLVQLELMIDKVKYTFIGPMQVLNPEEDKKDEPYLTVTLQGDK